MLLSSHSAWLQIATFSTAFWVCFLTQGTKIFQYCTRPAGRVTYNFHSSCKHMHSSLKIVCNKENGAGGSDVFEVPYITAKMIFTHCSQFHNCIPYTDKKSFTFNTHVATFFFQKRVYFRLFLQELSYVRHLNRNPVWLVFKSITPVNIQLSRRKFNNFRDTVCHYTNLFHWWKCTLKKVNIYFDTVYHTTAHYTAQLLFAICNHNIRFLLSELKRHVARWKRFQPFRKC